MSLSSGRAQIGYGLPVENGIDSRDGLNPELTGNEPIFIDIDFDQLHALIGIIRGDLFDNGSKLLAGAAPFRPKINDHQLRHRWFDNILPKCLYRRLFRLLQSQRRQLTSPANCSEDRKSTRLNSSP